MTGLFHLSLPVWNVVLRGAAVYLIVLVLLRLAGKRHLAQMSPTEFVAILLISNAVQNAMNGGDNSLLGGVILATVLIALSWVISFLTYRFRAARLLFEGAPTLVVHRGRAVEANMAGQHLAMSELRALLREQGIMRLEEVHSAVLEADGHLSVIHQDEVRATRRRT